MLNQAEYENDTAIDFVLAEAHAPSMLAAARHMIAAVGFEDQTLAEELVRELKAAPCGGGVAVTALQCPGLTTSSTVLGKFKVPLDLAGPDGMPVDLVCVLLYPETERAAYLRRLSRLTRLFRNSDLCVKIRETQDADMIRILMHSPEGWTLAA